MVKFSSRIFFTVWHHIILLWWGRIRLLGDSSACPAFCHCPFSFPLGGEKRSFQQIYSRKKKALKRTVCVYKGKICWKTLFSSAEMLFSGAGQAHWQLFQSPFFFKFLSMVIFFYCMTCWTAFFSRVTLTIKQLSLPYGKSCSKKYVFKPFTLEKRPLILNKNLNNNKLKFP